MLSLSYVPLYKWVARGQSAHCEAPKRKQWTEDMMERALEHNVTKSTLHDHMRGKVLQGAVGGTPRYLDDEEEEELVKWLKGCAEIGCAKSVREVCIVVGTIVAKNVTLRALLLAMGGGTGLGPVIHS